MVFTQPSLACLQSELPAQEGINLKAELKQKRKKQKEVSFIERNKGMNL